MECLFLKDLKGRLNSPSHSHKSHMHTASRSPTATLHACLAKGWNYQKCLANEELSSTYYLSIIYKNQLLYYNVSKIIIS